MLHKAPFTKDFIAKPIGGGNGHYRIADKDDNALCFCYSEANAQELIDQLNRVTISTVSEEALSTALRPAVSKIFDHFDDLSRGQALQAVIDALRDFPPAMTFADFSKISLQRSLRWHRHGIEEWSESEWTNAMGGEAGETAGAMVKLLSEQLGSAMEALRLLSAAGESMNAGKKLLRLVRGMQQHPGDSAVPTNILDARWKVAKEIGDTVAYCDLVCHRIGWRLEDAIKLAFNSVSEREGFPERL